MDTQASHHSDAEGRAQRGRPRSRLSKIKEAVRARPIMDPRPVPVLQALRDCHKIVGPTNIADPKCQRALVYGSVKQATAVNTGFMDVHSLLCGDADCAGSTVDKQYITREQYFIGAASGHEPYNTYVLGYISLLPKEERPIALAHICQPVSTILPSLDFFQICRPRGGPVLACSD